MANPQIENDPHCNSSFLRFQVRVAINQLLELTLGCGAQHAKPKTIDCMNRANSPPPSKCNLDALSTPLGGHCVSAQLDDATLGSAGFACLPFQAGDKLCLRDADGRRCIQAHGLEARFQQCPH
jgi:hypothetical protein